MGAVLGPSHLLLSLVLALLGRLVHGLKTDDPDPRVALGGESRVGEHIVETVPDDDVRPGQHALRSAS